MNWLLVIHITALLFWVAGLIYIPALLSVSKATGLNLPCVMFTHLVTPFALTAIIAGTLVFAFYYSFGAWLIIKLTLVVGLVLNHVLLGLLLMRAEAENHRPVGPWCLTSGLVTCLFAVAIVWVVLAKPVFESLS